MRTILLLLLTFSSLSAQTTWMRAMFTPDYFAAADLAANKVHSVSYTALPDPDMWFPDSIRNIRVFDPTGHVDSLIILNTIGLGSRSVDDFTRDPQGRPIRMESVGLAPGQTEDKDDILVEAMGYDDQGRYAWVWESRILRGRTIPIDTVWISYNRQDRPVKGTWGQTGELFFKVAYQGNAATWTFVYSEDMIITWTVERDERGNLSRVTESDPSMDQFAEWRYHYSQGRLAEETVLHSDEETQTKTTLRKTFQYGDRGLLRCIRIYREDKEIMRQTLEYTYY